MIEFMDEIVEAVEQFLEGATENAIYILLLLGKGAILITAPAWILPYVAIKTFLRCERSKKDAGNND